MNINLRNTAQSSYYNNKKIITSIMMKGITEEPFKASSVSFCISDAMAYALLTFHHCPCFNHYAISICREVYIINMHDISYCGQGEPVNIPKNIPFYLSWLLS